jgi:hypothetical protein
MEQLTYFGPFVLGVAALLTLIKVTIEYRNAQKWKRLEFIAQQTQRFFSNPINKNAMLMLDWDGREITFPFLDGTYVDENVSHKQIIQSLAIHGPFNDTETNIRDTFVDFFDNLGVFETYLASNLFSESDLRPYVIYWMDKINFELPDKLRASIHSFLEEYKYTDVVSLLSRYKPD